MNIILVLTVSLSIYQIESCKPEYFTSTIDNKSCCALCQAGFFMKKECDGFTETECMACPVNTHTSSPNKQLSCDCPTDMYWHTILLRCIECTKCKSGQKLKIPCEKEQDSRCEFCEKKTYLHGNECLPCSYCNKGETVMAECSASQNTVCRKVVWPPPTRVAVKRSPPVKIPVVQVAVTTPPQQEDAHTIPDSVVCKDTRGLTTTSLALVVVVIVLAFFLGSATLLLIRHKICQGSAVPRKSCSKKGMISRQKSSSTVIKENNIMFRDVSADVTERLGLLLNANSGNNWKNLAGLMGFTSTHTQNWDLTPTEATQKLLQDWSQGSGSTVFVLYNYLKQLGRDDAALILIPLLIDQVRDGELV